MDQWLGNYGDNPLEYVSRHQVKLSAYFRKNGDQTVNPPLSAMQVQAKYNALTQKEKNLVDKAFTTNIANEDYIKLAPYTFVNDQGEKETIDIPKSDIFEAFRNDVSQNKLPRVSWLVAPQKFSDHTSTPLYGTWYVSEALDILTSDPEIWKKTVFILTYDENDGYFDHIPPFVSPDPYDEGTGKVSPDIDVRVDFEKSSKNPIGLGYRVPMIIASPWSKGGFVNSEVFDHTSTIRFLETWLSKKEKREIRCNLISSYRRAICGDLSSAFRPFENREIPLPQKLDRESVIKNFQNARHQPPQAGPSALGAGDIAIINTVLPFEKNASVHFAMQEKGSRRACAIPYALGADVNVSEDGHTLRLRLEAAASRLGGKQNGRGAPFSVYTPGSYLDEAGRCWDFALSAGSTLTYDWDISSFTKGLYDLHVHGPNGFFRKFKGDQNTPSVNITLFEIRKGLIRKIVEELELLVQNDSTDDISLYLDNGRYHNYHQTVLLKAKSINRVRLKIDTAHHWYEINIRMKDHPNFLRQYAGHVETGEISVSDPYMGGEL